MKKSLPISIALALVFAAGTAVAQSSQSGGGHGGGSHGGGSGASHGGPGGGAHGAPSGGGTHGVGGPAGTHGGPILGSPHSGQWQSHSPAAHREFHGRVFGSLSQGERQRWVGGAWNHSWHNGVYGWWWIVDGDWFFYAEPIYPYPTYIAPILGVQETPPAPPPQPIWYHCSNPEGFYPYITACPGGWEQVPAQPQDAPPPPR